MAETRNTSWRVSFWQIASLLPFAGATFLSIVGNLGNVDTACALGNATGPSCGSRPLMMWVFEQHWLIPVLMFAGLLLFTYGERRTRIAELDNALLESREARAALERELEWTKGQIEPLIYARGEHRNLIDTHYAAQHGDQTLNQRRLADIEQSNQRHEMMINHLAAQIRGIPGFDGTEMSDDANARFNTLLAAMAPLGSERSHQPIEHQAGNALHVPAILKLHRY